MTEQILRDYFEGIISAKILSADLKGSQIKTSETTTSVSIHEMHENDFYIITRQHLLKLINDALIGNLASDDLNTVAFSLISSDHFTWDNETKDGKDVAKTLFEWDKFPLNIENLKLWRLYLEGQL